MRTFLHFDAKPKILSILVCIFLHFLYIFVPIGFFVFAIKKSRSFEGLRGRFE